MKYPRTVIYSKCFVFLEIIPEEYVWFILVLLLTADKTFCNFLRKKSVIIVMLVWYCVVMFANLLCQ